MRMSQYSSATLLLFSAFLFFIFTHPSFCSAARSPEPVYDIDGNRLRAGAAYNVFPADPSSGSGFELDIIGNKSCPFDVFQSQTDFQQALAFYPVNSRKGDIIRLSTDLNIGLPTTTTSCPQYQNFWKLDHYDRSAGKYFITTGGVKGKPGPKTIKNWFRIEKSRSHYYKLIYCPTVCSHCTVMCKDLGIFVQEGKKRVALSDVPFEFTFKKFKF